MTTKISISIILALTLAACSTENNKTKIESQQTSAESLSKDKNSTTAITNFDTLIVDKEAAVFYSPDTTQIANRKKEIGEENFYVGADDYLNYLHTSHDFLDSTKLIILDEKDKKYLKFIHSDKSQTIIKLDTLAELWGIYFFDPNKKPKLIDMTIIDEEYKSYFK
jgi:outer membrane lipoprotein-sorting protein